LVPTIELARQSNPENEPPEWGEHRVMKGSLLMGQGTDSAKKFTLAEAKYRTATFDPEQWVFPIERLVSSTCQDDRPVWRRIVSGSSWSGLAGPSQAPSTDFWQAP
jgi:hypothetical protein